MIYMPQLEFSGMTCYPIDDGKNYDDNLLVRDLKDIEECLAKLKE